MSDLFLIAHKVRGEPAFDIAERMICPECNEGNGMVKETYCLECEDKGYWWIIGTSGHRAYPFNTAKISEESLLILNEMPPSLPDHYPTRSPPKSEPSSGKLLLAQLGLIPKVVRRL